MATIREDDSRLILLGSAGALVLALVLIPFRALTPAANFAFAFLLLTIAIAEVGGALPVVATALTAALSLDFFLTPPYLTFAMEDKHDAVAFTGLVVCGLTVAGFRSWRTRRIQPPSEEALHLDLLRTVVERLGARGPAVETLQASLQEIARALPLAAVAVRDMNGTVIAAEGEARPIPPESLLQPDTLHTMDERGPHVLGVTTPLPATGARLRLQFRDRQAGWLDVWGDGTLATPETRRTLVDLSRLLAAALSR